MPGLLALIATCLAAHGASPAVRPGVGEGQEPAGSPPAAPGATGTAGAGVAGAFAPGDEGAWAIEQGGTRLGTCAVRYEGEVRIGPLRVHSFREEVVLRVPLAGETLEQRFTNLLWTDAGGHPLRFVFRSRARELLAGVEGCVVGGQAELSLYGKGTGRRPLTLEVPDPVFLLANNFVSELELMLAVDLPRSRTGAWTLLSVNALQTLPYSVRPAAPEGWLEDSLGERLLLEGGRLQRVEIPAQEIVIRRVEEPFEPFEIDLEEPRPPAGFESEAVAIRDDAVLLAGTVTRPAETEGRLPALFLLSGFLSGPGGQDRNGDVRGLDLGTRGLLDHLTRAGFLVLRLDQRGVGESRGPPLETLDDVVADGRRAVRFLFSREDVDPARVALIGQGEGGLAASLLAASEPIAGLVLLAAPGRPAAVRLAERLRLARERAGAPAGELEDVARQLQALLAFARGTGPPPEGLAPDVAALLPARAWLASLLERDPVAALQEVRCPVLVLQGARDVQVSAERDVPLLVAALDEAGNPDHGSRLFPELDHRFMHTPGSVGSPLDFLRPGPVDAEFLAFLTDWLAARLLP